MARYLGKPITLFRPSKFKTKIAFLNINLKPKRPLSLWPSFHEYPATAGYFFNQTRTFRSHTSCIRDCAWTFVSYERSEYENTNMPKRASMGWEQEYMRVFEQSEYTSRELEHECTARIVITIEHTPK
jgi:hypothetical protein